MSRTQDRIRQSIADMSTKPASIAHSITANANSEDHVSIPVEFEHFIVDAVDVYIESGAGIDVDVTLETDDNRIAPAHGALAGGGERLEAHSVYYLGREDMYVHYDNDASSSYDVQAVIHGRYVEQ